MTASELINTALSWRFTVSRDIDFVRVNKIKQSLKLDASLAPEPLSMVTSGCRRFTERNGGPARDDGTAEQRPRGPTTMQGDRQGDNKPEPDRPQWNALPIIALLAIAAATAAETRPGLPPALRESLAVFGSALLGYSVIYPIWAHRH
jgi:hypothetical protein